MNLKKVIIVGIAGVSITAFTSLVCSQAQAMDETNQVVFSPKASSDQCEENSGCVYYGEDGILVFVIPPMGSF